MDNERWLEGQYFGLLVYPDTDYGNGLIAHWYDVYVKTTEGRQWAYGAGGDHAPEEWLRFNDTVENQRRHIELFEIE